MDRILQLDARASDSPWASLSRQLGGDGVVLGAFALLYALLVWAGHQLQIAGASPPVVLWPAAGLLFVVLWLSGPRHWWSLLAIQVVIELALGSVVSGDSLLVLVGGALGHAAAGMVGALLIRRLVGAQSALRFVGLLWFMLAAAVGAGAAALIQSGFALAGGLVLHAGTYALIVGLASLLGVLGVVPILFAWSVAHLQLFPRLSRLQRIEVPLVAVVQVLLVWGVFYPEGAGALQGLRFPVYVVPGLVYAALRFPLRWNCLITGGTMLLVVAAVCMGGDPLGIQTPEVKAVWVQTVAVIFSGTIVVLAMFVGQSRLALQQLSASEGNYRSFIRLSSEALWRVEFAQPMPVDLPLEQQRIWLRAHARIVERSQSFAAIAAATGEDPDAWHERAPWAQLFEKHLELLAGNGYRADGLRFTVQLAGRSHTFLAAFHGVVEGGCLLRIWGVARDVTDLAELNARLLREQDRLRLYASRISTAEDEARRATAKELHDGISQELAGTSMTLKVLGDQLAPELRQLVDEVRAGLYRVQERTRGTISELSPPGLYDLGLEPALQWLAVYLRGRDQFQVTVDCALDEARLPTELRVLVFKLVRELLRNAIKHAGVRAATVSAWTEQARLLVQVADAGQGFEWLPDASGAPRRGFGLWSAAGRVADAGGSLRVDSAPGRGTRVILEFPLRADALAQQSRGSGADVA